MLEQIITVLIAEAKAHAADTPTPWDDMILAVAEKVVTNPKLIARVKARLAELGVEITASPQ